MRSNEPLIIVGGGLAGSLAALAIAARRPDVPLLLVEVATALGEITPGLTSMAMSSVTSWHWSKR